MSRVAGYRRRLFAGLAALSALSGFLAPAASAFTTTTPAAHLLAATATSPASAATTSPAETPSSSTSPTSSSSSSEPARDLGTAPNVRITSVGEPLLKSGADLKVQAVISNPSKKPLAISSVSLFGQDWVPDTRGGVLDFLDGDSFALSQLSIRESVGSVPAGQAVTVDFTVPRDELNWQDSFEEWGPRGIEVDVTLKDGSDLTDRSLVVVAPGVSLTPMPTGVVVPLTASAAQLSEYPPLSALLENRTPGAPEASDGATTAPPTASASPSQQPSPLPSPASSAAENPAAELAERYRIPGVTAVVDPGVLTAANASSDNALPTSLQSSVDSFVSQARTEMLFTPMHDVDAQALVRGGAPGYLQSAQLLSQEVAATQAAHPRTDVALLPSGSDQRTIAALASTGISAVILPDSDVPQAGFRTATASARSDIQLEVDASGYPSADISIPALTVDSVTSTALSGALSSGDDESDSKRRVSTLRQLDPLDSQQLVLALSAATYLELPNEPRAMLLALDRAGLDDYGKGEADPAAVQATLTALMAAPWITPTTVSEMLKLEPTYLEREPLAATNAPKTSITHSQLGILNQAAHTMSRYAALSSEPATLMDPTRAAIGRVQALAWRADPAGRKSQVSNISGTADAMLTKLQVLPSSTINIISQATELPVRVSNDLPVPVTVSIRLDSYDNRLKQTKPVEVTLQPHQSTAIPIPVEARGSGNIQASIRLVDAAGEEVGTGQILEIRVRADWETMGTAIIAALFGAVLLFGVVKSLRRGKKHDPVDPAEFAKADRERRQGVLASDGESGAAGEGGLEHGTGTDKTLAEAEETPGN
ncbi:MAG: DUF6049 family protein [Ancrocorticia sp.]